MITIAWFEFEGSNSHVLGGGVSGAAYDQWSPEGGSPQINNCKMGFPI